MCHVNQNNYSVYLSMCIYEVELTPINSQFQENLEICKYKNFFSITSQIHQLKIKST